MPDVHDKKTRSRNMAAIKGKNTKPEVWLRKELFKQGFRYRLHRKDLPGQPDIVLPKYQAVIFVHGCFWHGHQGCPMFRLPSTRTDFWQAKIETNRLRDKKNSKLLLEAGWRVLEVWECAMRGKSKRAPEELIAEVSHWICSGKNHTSIPVNDMA